MGGGKSFEWLGNLINTLAVESGFNSKGVFSSLSRIYDEFFCENTWRLKKLPHGHLKVTKICFCNFTLQLPSRQLPLQT